MPRIYHWAQQCLLACSLMSVLLETVVRWGKHCKLVSHCTHAAPNPEKVWKTMSLFGLIIFTLIWHVHRGMGTRPWNFTCHVEKESHLLNTNSMFDECQESQYINNIFSVALRSLELDPKEQWSCLEKMLCTFTAVICHPASMTDPTEDEPKQRMGDFLCNEDN